MICFSLVPCSLSLSLPHPTQTFPPLPLKVFSCFFLSVQKERVQLFGERKERERERD